MTHPTRADKVRRLRALHAGPGAFVIGNAWDAGSARLLGRLGFVALATSSAASAGTLGLKDGEPSRAQVLAHVAALAAATELPLSADLENGFGDAPATAAETIRLAADAGAAGGSIEDAPRDAAAPVDDLALAVERVHAAAEAARALPGGFVLTARCEHFLRGRPDLDDTIRRLQAYAEAGADVLFAPGLHTLEQVAAVCAALGDKPVNFMAGIPGRSFSVAELEAAGVRRISLATSLYRAAMRAAERAATEVLRDGTFGYLNG
jgi:2-methylisocitrate lyase-like PEP mutase family enzyme